MLTNHHALTEVLHERCGGGHRHVQLIGKSACSRAATYPAGLCNAVLKGIQVIKKKRAAIAVIQQEIDNSGLCGLQPHPEDVLFEIELEDMCEQDPATWEEVAGQCWEEYSQQPGVTLDSTTGEVFNPTRVQKGVMGKWHSCPRWGSGKR